jgi:hypothetical protein
VSDRFVLLGAHLAESDTTIEGITSFPAADLFLSSVRHSAVEGVGDRALIARVARLRSELVQRQTFVAIRYGASVSGPEEAALKVAAHTARWRELLSRHRGTFEMTLKVLASEAEPDPDRREFTSGADYLRALYAARSKKKADPDFLRAAEDAFQPLSTAARWVKREDAAFELAFLASRDRFDEVRDAAEMLKERFPRLPFLLSGPWPLEVFAE